MNTDWLDETLAELIAEGKFPSIRKSEEDLILIDALSMKLFGKNVNSTPSKAWMMIATEEEIAVWQTGDRFLEGILADRLAVKKQVDNYTKEMAEEEEGIRHSIPDLTEDLEPYRNIDIKSFSHNNFKRGGKSYTTKCIFHDDHNPSCSIYEGGRFKCWSCNKSGNAIDWCMREFGFDFKSAIEYLKRYV